MVRPEQSGDARREARVRHLWTRYRIPVAVWEARYARQGGRCGACHKPGGDLRAPQAMVPDHDHETGRLRKLCHGKCNQLVGLVEAYLDAVATEDLGEEFVIPAERLAALEESAARARAHKREPQPPREEPGERTTYRYGTRGVADAIDLLERT